MSTTRLRSLRARLVASFLVVAVLPLGLAAIVVYQRQRSDDQVEIFSKLEAIRNLKVARIDAWVDEITGDMQDFAADAQVVLLPPGAVAVSRDPAAIATLRGRLQRYVRTHKLLGEVLITDAVTGKVIVASDPAREGKDGTGTKLFASILQSRALAIGDMELSPLTHRPSLAFGAPVLLPGAGAQVAAVVTGDVDLWMMSTLIQDRTGMGETGETLLVSPDLLALNELRHVPAATLRFKLAAGPSIRAARGETGVFESTDYRGVPVLAAYTYLPRLRWGLVAKQDLDEVYLSLRATARATQGALAGALLLVVLLAGLVAQTLARPIRKMRATAEAIRGGDSEARNRLDTRDELGLLGHAFDEMADALQSRLAVEERGRALVEALVHSGTVEALCGRLLDAALATTDSEFGAVYLADSAGRLTAKAARGLALAALEPFDGARAEGAIGAAVASRRLQHQADLPADTRFTWRTVAGTAIPRALLALPLEAEGRVVAVLALGSLRGYAPAAVAALESSRVALSIGLANLLSREEATRLAHQLTDQNTELQEQAKRLETQSAELQKQSQSLEQQNVLLEQQAARVEDASRLKSQFLSNMSHELRTPLNSVLALSRVLQLQTADRLSAEESSYLEIIERNGKNLLLLINDILDLAKIEAGRMEVASEEVSLPLLLQAVADGVRPLADQKGITLAVHLAPDLPTLRSDPRRLQQILVNLIGNAVKFTLRGGVEVRARQRGAEVEVAVSDTGIGISAAAIPTLFEEFRQVDGSTSRSFEGTGLGLAIASKSAGLLGGKITVVSKLGQGSVFTLSLPASAPAQAAPRPPTRPNLAAAELRLVLIVDDVPEDSAVIARHLQREGFQTLECTSGTAALQLAEERRPVAITLDLMMPDLDGWEVLGQLKRNPATAEIPVVVVSRSEDLATGLALGAFALLAKPVDPELLAAHLLRATARGTPSPSLPLVRPTAGALGRILLVEDSEPAILQIKLVLETAGYRVDVARGGREALERMEGPPPDGIILDLMMPQVDGFAVLEKLRGAPATAGLPVLILTAKDLDQADLSRLSRNHVQQLVQKGDVDKEQLLRKVAELLRPLPAPAPTAPQPTRAPPRSAARPSGLPTVLAVEDNADNLTTLRAILGARCKLLEARDGLEGVALALGHQPDLVLLDLSLPKLDGFGVLARLRADTMGRHLPVIALTAHAMKGDRERLLAAGCDDYLSKPIDVPLLLQLVDRWTGSGSAP